MPKQIIDDSIWEARIPKALEYRAKWEELFECSNLERYYEGFQYKNVDRDDPQYVINKVYETIQIKLDSFMSADFAYNVNPRPINSDFDLEGAAISAQLKEAVLNTLVADDNLHFSSEVKSTYRDSYFRFGVIEVGYAADWVINKNAAKPATNYDTEESPSGDKVKIKSEPEELAVNERVYFKHIPARDFIVGGIDHKYLHRCTFYGYKEWVHKSDLLALKGLMNQDEIEQALGSPDRNDATTDPTELEHNSVDDAVAIWHLWDNRTKTRVIVLDESWITIWQVGFTRQSIFDYRHDLRAVSEGFYPVPPVFHWLSPQRELNEIREQMKNHRKRFVRQYQAIENTVEPEEIDKFESGEDGRIIITKRENAIQPIQSADLNIVTDKMLATATDDLNKISGTSVINRGDSARTTATESTLIDQKANLRENAEKTRIGKWLSRIGREILLIVRDRFVFGLWVELTADSQETLFAEVQANAKSYHHVTSEDLKDGYDFRIIVDPVYFSSVSREEAKQAFIEFISFVAQFPAVAMSPKLIREAAYRIGYRNEAVIREMQKMALMTQYGAMMGMQQLGQTPGVAQQKVQQMTPPGMEQIRQQLTGQLG